MQKNEQQKLLNRQRIKGIMQRNSKKRSQKSTKHSQIIQSPHLSIKKIYTVFLTLLNSLWMGVKLFFNQMKGLKKSFFPRLKEMYSTVARQVEEKVLPFLLTPLGIVTMAIIVGFFLGVLLMSLLN